MYGNFVAAGGRLLSLFALLLTLTALPAGAEQPYQINASAFPFNADDLQLEAANRKQLASNLAEWARELSYGNAEQKQIAARALVVALGIDPTNRTAVIAKARFRRGDELGKPGEKIDTNELAKVLVQNAKLMKEVGNEPDRQVAAYLAELAYEAAPGNDEIIYETELLRAELKLAVSWDELVFGTKSNPSATAMPTDTGTDSGTEPGDGDGVSEGDEEVAEEDTPAAPIPTGPPVGTAQINGLVVKGTGDSFIGGQVMEINATLIDRPGQPTDADFTTKVEKEMRISKEEAVRLALARVPKAARDKFVQLSFEFKYTQKDGGSAGTAFCVVIMSLLEGFTLDNEVAMTGDITVDGNVGIVGGISDKVKAASKAGLRHVGIPQSNLPELDNFLVLGNASQLAKIQVYSMDTIEEAIDLARSERSDNLQAAMDKFAQVQKNFEGRYWGAAVKEPANQALLKEVVELAPNHQSAQYLLKASRGEIPRYLTITASLDGMFSTMAPVLNDIAGDKIKHHQVSNRTMQQVKGQLKTLSRKIHPKTQRVYHDLLNLIQQVENFQLTLFRRSSLNTASGLTQSDVMHLNRQIDSLNGSWSRIVETLKALDYDNEFKAELLRK